MKLSQLKLITRVCWICTPFLLHIQGEHQHATRFIPPRMRRLTSKEEKITLNNGGSLENGAQSPDQLSLATVTKATECHQLPSQSAFPQYSISKTGFSQVPHSLSSAECWDDEMDEYAPTFKLHVEPHKKITMGTKSKDAKQGPGIAGRFPDCVSKNWKTDEMKTRVSPVDSSGKQTSCQYINQKCPLGFFS